MSKKLGSAGSSPLSTAKMQSISRDSSVDIPPTLDATSSSPLSPTTSIVSDGCNCMLCLALSITGQRPHVDAALHQKTVLLQTRKDDAEVLAILRAAWALVLGRLADSEDVAFGIGTIVRADRTNSTTANLVVAPVEIRLAKKQAVSEFLNAAQQQVTEGIPFQQYYAEKISKTCQRTKIASPFQSLFVMERQGSGPGVDQVWGLPDSHSHHSRQDVALILAARVHEGHVRLHARADPTIVEPWMVDNLLRQLDSVTHQLEDASSDHWIGDIEALTPRDLQQIWEWNHTLPESIDRCVHQVIEERARSHPEAPAVCAWDGELTYGELEDLATGLASRLAELAVRPGTAVPLCFEKSMWTTVAMLGVMKTGASFVLLDPSLPVSRLQDMTRQIKARVILSSISQEHLSSTLAAQVFTLGPHLSSALRNEWPHPRLPSPDPWSVVYMTFTSGSTGLPKGVMITHRNLASAMHHQIKGLKRSSTSRVYDFSSYAFDVSICNLVTTLAAGGCFCVPSDWDRRERLPESIVALNANSVDLTPSVARLLSPAQVPCLKTIIFGGEALDKRDVGRWWDKVDVRNAYGPCECTTNSTINSQAASVSDAVFLGKGAGVATWVVDAGDDNVLLPPGFVGELVLEGPLVGHGYLNEPEKTAASFIPAPGWLRRGAPGHPGRHGILYKTGDLVRYSEMGDLIFVGRKDAQVKIRGQREWSSATLSMPCQHDGNRDARLAAFFTVCDDGSALTAKQAYRKESHQADNSTEDGLRAMLQAKLPSYMVPQTLTLLDKMPMTKSDKIDRRALAMQVPTREAGQSSVQQPRTMAEAQIQRIWAHVLETEASNIGIDHDFFQIGGNSIYAMEAAAEARKVNLGLAVADIFRHPVLKDLAGQSVQIVDKSPDSVEPFALLGAGFDTSLFQQEISSQYGLDTAVLQDAYPCTPLQEGLMSLASKRPGDYVRQGVVDLSVDITVENLVPAWEEVFRALPILRSRIIQYNQDGLLQVVLQEDMHWIAARGLQQYLDTDKRQAMGLGQPLTRFALVRDDTGALRWFVWSIHHALYDGWSLRLIADAVSRAYRSEPVNPGPPFQAFIKYIKEDGDELVVKYWQDVMQDFQGAAFPKIPCSFGQPVADARLERRFPQRQDGHLEITTSIMFRAALAIVIGKMTDSDDVVFGATVYGRNAPVAGLEDIVAPTMATVPVRVRLNKDQSILQYLKTVQQEGAEMIPFEQTGLQRIAKTCPAARDACMFQTHLIVQPEDQAAGHHLLGACPEDGEENLNTYALSFEVWLGTDEITISASFDSRVMESWVVDGMLRRIHHVMHELDEASPNAALVDLATLTPYDLERVWGWNRSVPAAIERCVHDLIEETAQKQPDLDQLATELAWRLADLEVGPDTLVPLCFEKSMWTTVAILGVIKAGGGFVLLDPSLPEQRLYAIAEKAKVNFIVSSTSNASLCSRLKKKVLILSEELFASRVSGTNRHIRAPSPSSILYVVFTSGSTGIPKGVVITHKNAASALHHQQSLFGFTAESRTFDFSSYSFDVSISNTLTILTAGGCLCVPSDHDRHNDLERSIVSSRANVIDFTPSTARFLAAPRLPDIDTIILGGASLTVADVEQWRDKAQVIHIYGPCECTAASTINCHGLRSGDVTNIGKGAGLVTWVVSQRSHNELLPPGCIGELLLEGPLVGLGYMDDPGKTAAAFINDPTWLVQGASGQPGRRGRLYKTGDLVRYREDGTLAFVGRRDAQVKIRGQRVELEEVEYWLRRCLPGAAHVLAEMIEPRGNASGPVLAAFLQIPDRGSGSEATMTQTANIIDVPPEVEHQLAESLPSYAVPTAFFSMRELPLGPTGKMNRLWLREIGASFTVEQLASHQTDGGERKRKRPPSSKIEHCVQKIWSGLLNVDVAEIGLDDSFFSFGGDSITAMRFVAEARKAGLLLSVADVFRHRKLHRIASSAVPLDHDTLTSIPRIATRGPAALSYAQERIWHLHTSRPGLAWLLLPCAMRLRGPLQLGALSVAVHAMERRHEPLRTTFALTNGFIAQLVQPFQARDLDLVDVPGPECDVVHLIRQDQMKPFRLETEPGWRVRVYRLKEDDFILSIVMHHVVSDGWSVDHMMTELAAFYALAVCGKDPLHVVEPLPIQYRDYAAWQNTRIHCEEYQRQLEYWMAQLKTSQAAAIPYDLPRPPDLSGVADVRYLWADSLLQDRLHKFCVYRDLTLFVVLLAAFRATHYCMTGAADAAIGTANANRDRDELESMIGLFANLQCIRTAIAGETTFEELIGQVKTATIAAFANQDAPLDEIAPAKEERDYLSRHPLLQIFFALHSGRDLGRSLFEGVETEPFATVTTSRFDVEFHLYQEANGLRAEVVFSRELYKPATIDVLLANFYSVLKQALAEPRTAISSFSLIN
ncbi:hypothetical protein MY4824_007777 [Beauveria thailandica]